MGLRQLVAQVSNLLYRGFPTRGSGHSASAWKRPARCRLEIGDTAGWNPARRRHGQSAGSTIRPAIIALLLLCAAAARTEVEMPRFQAIDIFVDSKERLAAYQIEFFATAGEVKIVGIEGGEHAAFKDAPHYDPRAIQRERVIMAAFNTASSEQLPQGRTRLATVHVQISGAERPEYRIELAVAAGPDGERIPAAAAFNERQP